MQEKDDAQLNINKNTATESVDMQAIATEEGEKDGLIKAVYLQEFKFAKWCNEPIKKRTK